MLSFALNAGTKSTDIKTGNTNIIDGISPEVINGLNQISGIASIDYSVYESERSWFWDNQDYTKMGIDKLKDVYTPQSSETVKILWISHMLTDIFLRRNMLIQRRRYMI